MKKIKIIVLVILASIILFWIIALLRCEILTLRYEEQFKEAYMQTGMISSIVDMKVLDFEDESASIYYICEGGTWSSRVEFVRNASGWQMTSWDCIWSRFGSANNVVWPYIWHNLQYIQIPYWKGE